MRIFPHKSINGKVLLFLFFIFYFILPFSLQAQNTNTNTSSAATTYADDILYPLEVPIGNKLYIENLTDYITTVYNFAVSIAGILAVVVIMYGGLRWATSAGN
ncbi:MAG: hypothetical protein WC752_02015, partial [Patescibacteria group bacterium]